MPWLEPAAGGRALRAGRVRLAGSIELPYLELVNVDGAAVVLLHGYGDSWRSFEPMLSRLPESMRALAVTQRGHGDASSRVLTRSVSEPARMTEHR